MQQSSGVPTPFFARVFAMHPLALIAGLCLIALTIPAYRLLDAERANVGAVPRAIADTRTAAVEQLGTLGKGIDAHATALEGKLDARLGSIEKRLFGEVHQAVNDPEGPLGRAIARADVRLGEATTAVTTAAGSVRTVAAALAPAIEKTGDTVAALKPGFENGSLMAENVRQALTPMLDCHDNAACLPSETTGILGGSKTLLGEAALTARAWRKESPKIAANVEGITGNAEKLSRPRKALAVIKYAAPIVGAIIAGRVARR